MPLVMAARMHIGFFAHGVYWAKITEVSDRWVRFHKNKKRSSLGKAAAASRGVSLK
jgi:hypothetical protein